MTELEHVNCPVCGPSQTTIWLDDSELTSYVRCKDLRDSLCISKVVPKRASHSNRYHLEFLAESIIFRIVRHPALRQEADFIQRYVRNGKLLDVGCSSGDFFQFFPQPAWERYGVDLSASAAAYAAQAYSAQVFAGTLRSANWPGNISMS